MTTVSLSFWRSCQLIEDLLVAHLRMIPMQHYAEAYFTLATYYTQKNFTVLAQHIQGEKNVHAKITLAEEGKQEKHYAMLSLFQWNQSPLSLLISVIIYEDSSPRIQIQGVISKYENNDPTSGEKDRYMVHHVTFSAVDQLSVLGA